MWCNFCCLKTFAWISTSCTVFISDYHSPRKWVFVCLCLSEQLRWMSVRFYNSGDEPSYLKEVFMTTTFPWNKCWWWVMHPSVPELHAAICSLWRSGRGSSKLIWSSTRGRCLALSWPFGLISVSGEIDAALSVISPTAAPLICLSGLNIQTHTPAVASLFLLFFYLILSVMCNFTQVNTSGSFFFQRKTTQKTEGTGSESLPF